MAGDSNPSTPDGKSVERRRMVRYPSQSGASVVRDSDRMRTGIEGRVLDVSMMGLGVLLPTPLELNEQVKLTVTNPVQRFTKATRGFVRHVTAREDGLFHVGIGLQVRLTPLEVLLLKMGIPIETDADTKFWI